MARPESVAVGGYYPTPPSLLSNIASAIETPSAAAPPVILDPCAGTGDAVLALRDAWSLPDTGSYARPRIVACELEAERAHVLRLALRGPRDVHHHADAFRLVPSSSSTGASILFLNPPYDHDAETRRLEHHFLVRFTEHLVAGAGILLFLVPHAALEASADYLPSRYAELRCWRLPDPEFARFGQVLVVGRRRARPVDPDELSCARIRAWAHAPDQLPVLPERVSEPLVLAPEASAHPSLTYTVEPLDLTAVSQAFDPWPEGETGGHHDVDELLGARFEVALPPRPAHIALALASGTFNGHRLEPDDPQRHPPILAKGAYTRQPVEIDSRELDDGSVSITTVDRPRLRVTVLDLATSAFHTLAEGTEPSGADNLAHWTAADLLLHYSRSMSDLLGRQFPALHDPSRPDHQLTLPPLPRRPYTVQAHAVRAALKLLATGRNPFFVAEVGTGKTTMALYVLAALSPAYHAATAGQLHDLGFPVVPPVVRRALVLCPPHLLGSWRDQAEAVFPSARVQIVDSAADLEADADLYVLSRERAKLGYGHEGLTGHCPGCHAPIKTTAASNASRRLRCRATVRRPLDLLARLAADLATVLAPVLPTESLVAELAASRVLGAARGRGSASLPQAPLLALRDSYLRRLPSTLRSPSGVHPSNPFYTLLRALGAMTLALGLPLEDFAENLSRLADTTPDEEVQPLLRSQAATVANHYHPDLEPPRRLLSLLEDLDAEASWDLSPCDEPLWQATTPRRIPLASWILRRYRERFDLVVLDEAHEYNDAASAQSKAAHRLTGIPGVPTLVLTGSLMGGYASSLFTNFHALSPAFRREFERDELAQFVARYGYQKIRLTHRGDDAIRSRGRHTDRDLTSRRVIGEAPGIHPLFLMRYLLDTAVVVHKSDLDDALPPLTETPVPLDPPDYDRQATELLAEYRRLERELLSRIARDRSDPMRAGRLFGALVELPSYLDRATDDLEPFTVRYPESAGGDLVSTARAFDRTWCTPKERWLLREVERRVAQGERLLVFLRHTQSRLPKRLLRLLRRIVPGAAFLDAKKVPTSRREAWIDRNVNDARVPVLLVNPNAIRTGLNNLVGFSTAIFLELDPSAFTYRQAIGRLHRIGQGRPVEILVPHYADTAQEVTFRLVAAKVSASLQVDGLDVRAALEAAGAGDDLPDGLDAALSLGQAIYRNLTGFAA